jgi:3',5'-cyclic AMP phosphodiesterase CpdA
LKTPPLQLAHLSIENWRSLDRAEVDFMSAGSPRLRTVLLGENGAGKTSILRAIALSVAPLTEATALAAELVGTQRRINRSGNTAEVARIVARFYDPTRPDETFEVVTRVVESEDGREELRRETTPGAFPWARIIAAGYGVGRGVRGSAELGAYDRRQALRSLFRDDAPLFDAESVLKSVALEPEPAVEVTPQRTRKGPPFPTLNYFRFVIRRLFRLNSNHAIDVDSRGVRVHGPWGAQPFHALGDGYRSTAGWVLDFLGRTFAAGAGLGAEPTGLVLVDEVDEHLHPSWAREILGLLSKTFPEVQFVATTHSPVTIVDTRPDEVVLVRQHNTLVEVLQNLPDTSAMTIDALLRGRWFGLDQTMDAETEVLLARYKAALRDATGAELDAARHALLMRAPALCATPIEEVAIRAAETLRVERKTPDGGPAPTLEEVVAALRVRLASNETLR